jgi:glycosyltransferase involved in cell wall biosynthesis
MVDSPAGRHRKDGPADARKTSITGIVTTFNEERHVGECIQSLLWCDEILIVDSYSTDRTAEIAQAYPKARFLQHPYYGSASQKNWAMDQATHDWAFILDADERCPDRLRDEIKQILASGPIHDAYTIRRRSYFLGKIMPFSGWQRDKVVRLVKNGGGRCPQRRVHGDIVPFGKAAYFGVRGARWFERHPNWGGRRGLHPCEDVGLVGRHG